MWQPRTCRAKLDIVCFSGLVHSTPGLLVILNEGWHLASFAVIGDLDDRFLLSFVEVPYAMG